MYKVFGLNVRNVQFRFAAQPATSAKYEYRIVHDPGLANRYPKLAARHPDANLGGPVSRVQRRPVRAKDEWYVTAGAAVVGLAGLYVGWTAWRDSDVLVLLGACLLVLISGLAFLFPTHRWEDSPGPPLALAAKRAPPEAESDWSPLVRVQAVPVGYWRELDEASRSDA